MSVYTSGRFARKSALAMLALLVAVSGLAGCSSGGGGCPESFLELVADGQAEALDPRVVPASEFPVEELRSPLAGACIVASRTSPGGAGEFYMAVAPIEVGPETLADAATGAGFEWTDLGGEKPHGTYVRNPDPTMSPLSEYLLLQEVDAAFVDHVGDHFVHGQVVLFYQIVEVIVD